MSYREIKNVTDVLRRMGYVRLVSLESFRSPNFPLLGDILSWYLKRYDPATHDTIDLSTESERVTFIRYFVQQMLRKTGIKLNGRRLYEADGYAVKELAKLISFYAKATSLDKDTGSQLGHKDMMTQFYQLQPSLHKVKVTRDLSTGLTEKGVTFFDLVTKESSIGTGREAVLAKPFDLRDYDQMLTKATQSIKKEETRLKSSMDSALHTHSSLDIKIEKKRQELERSQQRLETMAKVRPAYMDDFEKVQNELELLYHQYVSRFRILAHLQHQMEEQGSHQIGGAQKVDHGPPGSPPMEDLSSAEDESLEISLEGKRSSEVKKNNTATGQSGQESRGRSSRSKGLLNMYGGLDEDESESDSEMLMLEGENSDVGSDDEEGVDLFNSMRDSYKGRSSAKGPNPGRDVHDDPADMNGYSRILSGTMKKTKSFDDSDDLTQPLKPDPRYSSNGHGRAGRELSASSTLVNRPSTKDTKRLRSGNLIDHKKGDRPTTRPVSRVTQLLHQLNEEDLE